MTKLSKYLNYCKITESPKFCKTTKFPKLAKFYKISKFTELSKFGRITKLPNFENLPSYRYLEIHQMTAILKNYRNLEKLSNYRNYRIFDIVKFQNLVNNRITQFSKVIKLPIVRNSPNDLNFEKLPNSWSVKLRK